MTKLQNGGSLISIIMPAYNSEKYIQDAIASVINQTYQNWELIIIDDYSQDNTFNICSEFEKKDNRIKVIRNNQNKGVSKSRNKGISIASGEWIAFLDSDDIWVETKLERQIKIAEQKNLEFIFTGSSFIREDGTPYKGIFNVPEIVDFKKLRNQNVISCSSVMCKKSFFENIKMENDDMHEDYAVWLRILKKGVIAYGLNEPLLIYRISKKSKSGNKIKTIKMTYNVFRFIGMNSLSSLYFTLRHIIGAIRKYQEIK